MNGARPTFADLQRAGACVRVDAAELGRALRRLRRTRRLSIEGLAHAADMHPTYLSGIERGVRNPTWSKLSDLALALGQPLSLLTRDAEREARIMRIAQSVAQALDEREAA
jgi:transcriptional regulator with XRE-family HTH domain